MVNPVSPKTARMGMATFEDELRKRRNVIRRIVALGLFGKTILVRGREHIPRRGPVVLISNHCGAFKDPAVVFRIAPRPLFFNANRMLFEREALDALVRKHLRRHLKGFGLFLDLLLGPWKWLFVRFVSRNIARFGTIPVDMYGPGKREAILRFMDYLRKGRATVSMQGRGRVHPEDPHPYIRTFGRGIPWVAYGLFAESGLDVPVVPLAIYGTQRLWGVPGRIRVHVGPPRFIGSVRGGSAEEVVERFRSDLQSAVERLFLQIVRNPKDFDRTAESGLPRPGEGI